MTEEQQRRRWHLEAYNGSEKVHTSTCFGDRALDVAMKSIEGRYYRPRIVVRLAA
ncbi:hypothetical protein GCM10009795_039790 [Nocardioides hankookensis]|uniref:Uncharacterized protein n=1 Tax=Nocardioides hankookensis TaxID=443157 RepID=A0ABW1LQP3_9ACTN